MTQGLVAGVQGEPQPRGWWAVPAGCKRLPNWRRRGRPGVMGSGPLCGWMWRSAEQCGLQSQFNEVPKTTGRAVNASGDTAAGRRLSTERIRQGWPCEVHMSPPRGSYPVPQGWPCFQTLGKPASGNRLPATLPPGAPSPLWAGCGLWASQAVGAFEVPAQCTWAQQASASTWLPARPTTCSVRWPTSPATSSCRQGLCSRRLQAGRAEGSPSLGTSRGRVLPFLLMLVGITPKM